MGILRLATRGSPLALRQTAIVSELLLRAHAGLTLERVVVRTEGDRDASTPLDQIGGQGVFVTEAEAAVTDGRADAAVHSAKDMPSTMAGHLVLGAVPPRGDRRDGLVGCSLAGLPPGGLVATGSVRRRAQLAYLRPDLVFTGLRGNMARRVAEATEGRVSAVVVAVAAMDRLGWADRLSDVLDPLDVLPQAGQGAIAVQCRAGDEPTLGLLRAIDDAPGRRTLVAERALLAALGGSCTVPVAGYAELVGGHEGRRPRGSLRLTGLLAGADGRLVVRRSRGGEDPEALGHAVAEALLEGGAAAVEGFSWGLSGVQVSVP